MISLNRKNILALVAFALLSLVVMVKATAASAQIGFEGPFGMSMQDDSGVVLTQAGAHAAQVTTFQLNKTTERNGFQIPDEVLRDVRVELPPGLVGDSTVVPACPPKDYTNILECPPSSQVGVITINSQIGSFIPPTTLVTVPVFLTEPGPGQLARMLFKLSGVNIPIVVSDRTGSDYGLTATIKDIANGSLSSGSKLTLWRVPADPSHDAMRGTSFVCNGDPSLPENCFQGGFSAGIRPKPFLINPTNCQEPQVARIEIDSWEHPQRSATAEDVEPALTGCASLPFDPSLDIEPETTAVDSPTGVAVNLHFPQQGTTSPNGLATAHLRDAHVTLAEGLTINPASADGLAVCADDQLAFGSSRPVACPAASKIGTATATTPLLDESLTGSVFLRPQRSDDPESGELFRLALVLENEERGLLIKLLGQVRANATTGRLEAAFVENPQLPVEDLSVRLKGGPRAPLATPSSCGAKESSAVLTSWAGQKVMPRSSFDVACAQGSVFGPSLNAGSTNPMGGASSPFVVKVSRADGQPPLSRINVKLPLGVSAALKGVPYCPDAAIAAAAGRAGNAELADPSCPAASQVGTVQVGAGAGPNPFYVAGKAYLAGPYKGAPLSLAVVTPAVAGPFDLGTVVVRTALQVDVKTAQVTALSDPLPEIVKGVPLRLRSVAIAIDRPEFIRNPTSCEPFAVEGELFATTGARATPTAPFEAADCANLEFKPSLALALKGSSRHGGHPALSATLTFPQKGRFANISRAQVGLPHSLFLDQGNLDNVCRQADLRAGTCPASSVYGKARAWTPLLDHPLEGPVYLGVGYGHKLPDLVAELNGQIRILLNGKIDQTKQKGLRNTFEAVPDAPVSKFTLNLKGGKKYGLIINSENLCRKAQKASVQFTAHNGKTLHAAPKIGLRCRGKKKSG